MKFAEARGVRPEESYAPQYQRYPGRGSIVAKRSHRRALQPCRDCHTFHYVNPDPARRRPARHALA